MKPRRIETTTRLAAEWSVLRIESSPVDFRISQDEPEMVKVCGFTVRRDELDALCRAWLDARVRSLAATTVGTES